MACLQPLVGAGLVLVLGGCQSEEIRAKCIAAADPASCERAEYERIRDVDRRREEERQRSGGSGGY